MASPAFADVAREDEQETSAPAPRASATLGVNLYAIDAPYDNEGVTGFWDQYRHIPDKGDSLPFFIDVIHFDVGLARDDDTYLFRIQRFSPNAINDRANLELDWKGLALDFDYQRYRSDSLRFFPRGTYQDETLPSVPVLGTQYTPDLRVADFFDSNKRFHTRRIGIGGELRLRPEGFGFDTPLLSQLHLRSSYQKREGWRQDSFLLDSVNEPTPGLEPSRFRGNRRQLNQEVLNVSGGGLLSTGRVFNVALDVGFENFKQNTGTVTFADIAASDPNSLLPTPTGNHALRAFSYTPETNRVHGTLRANSTLGPLSLNGSVFVTHLEQRDLSPLQETLGLRKNEVTTVSVQGAFDLEAHALFDVNGFFKFVDRDNSLAERDFPPFDVNDLGSGSARADAILEGRRELDLGVEFTARPRAGALIATGYRLETVDRMLVFPAAGSTQRLDPGVNLQSDASTTNTVYARGRWRLLRSGQLQGEIGYLFASQADYPRDFENAVYFEGRASYTFTGRVPVTLGLFGEVIDGNSKGFLLGNSNTRVRKDFDRTEYEWGVNISALPFDGTAVFATFVHDKDDQRFPYVRTDDPPYDDPAVVDYFLDSQVAFETEVHSLILGGKHQLTRKLDVQGSAALTWLDTSFPNANATSAALDTATRIDARILALQARVAWQARDGLRLAAGYRFQEYNDKAMLDPIERDSTVHTTTLSVTVDLGLFGKH